MDGYVANLYTLFEVVSQLQLQMLAAEIDVFIVPSSQHYDAMTTVAFGFKTKFHLGFVWNFRSSFLANRLSI